MLEFIEKHVSKHGQVPSVTLVQTKFTQYEHFVPEDNIAAICDQVLEANFNLGLNDVIARAVDRLRTGSEPNSMILSRLQTSLTSLNKRYNPKNMDLLLASYVDELHKEYNVTKNTLDGVVGIRYPWETLNKITGGLCPEQVVVIYGRAKSCKTWLLLKMASFMLTSERKKVLIVTKEMTVKEIGKRCCAIMGEVPYTLFRAGQLDTDVEKKTFDLLFGLNGLPEFRISDGRVGGGPVSVSSIKAKIEEYEPDVVFIDGVYLLDDDRTNQKVTDWKNVSNITQDVKELAQITHLPIVMTTQANRTGDRKSRTQDISYYNILQNVDMAISVLRDKQAQEIAMVIKALREGEESGFVVNAKVANDFTEKYSTIRNLDKYVTADDLAIASEQEEEDPPGSLPRRRGKRENNDPGIPDGTTNFFTKSEASSFTKEAASSSVVVETPSDPVPEVIDGDT